MSTTFTALLNGADGVALTASSTGGNSGFDTRAGAWTFTTAQKAEGTASATITSAAAAVSLTHQHALTGIRYYDWCQRFSAFDGGGLLVGQILNGGTNKAQVMINAGGTVSIKNGTIAVDTSVTSLNTAEWFRLQWGINGTTQTLRIYVSATLADLFNNPQTETISGNYSGGDWDRIKFGSAVAHTHTVWLDNVIVDNATWPTSGGSGNLAPIANAGPDQGVASGATVTLTSAASSDPDGTVASRVWSQVSGPVVTLSSTTATSPTFTAPTVTSSTDLVFGVRVTDNDGTESTQDTVTITVAAGSGYTPTEAFYELFNTGPNGTAITTSNSSMSSVDAGITFSSGGIGEGPFCATGSAAAAIKNMVKTFASAQTDHYIDAVFQLSTLTGGPFYILHCNSGGATVRAGVRVDAAGTIGIRNGTTLVATSTATVAANQPFRIAWRTNNAGGTQTLRLYTGSNLWGSSPDTGGTLTGNFTTGTFDRYLLGNNAVNTVTWKIDTIRADPTTWPAPVPSTTPTVSNAFGVSAGAWAPVDVLRVVGGVWA